MAQAALRASAERRVVISSGTHFDDQQWLNRLALPHATCYRDYGCRVSGFWPALQDKQLRQGLLGKAKASSFVTLRQVDVCPLRSKLQGSFRGGFRSLGSTTKHWLPAGQQAAFIFRGGCLQEVNLVKPTFGSWFADENVIEGRILSFLHERRISKMWGALEL